MSSENTEFPLYPQQPHPSFPSPLPVGYMPSMLAHSGPTIVQVLVERTSPPHRVGRANAVHRAGYSGVSNRPTRLREDDPEIVMRFLNEFPDGVPGQDMSQVPLPPLSRPYPGAHTRERVQPLQSSRHIQPLPPHRYAQVTQPLFSPILPSRYNTPSPPLLPQQRPPPFPGDFFHPYQPNQHASAFPSNYQAQRFQIPPYQFNYHHPTQMHYPLPPRSSLPPGRGPSMHPQRHHPPLSPLQDPNPMAPPFQDGRPLIYPPQYYEPIRHQDPQPQPPPPVRRRQQQTYNPIESPRPVIGQPVQGQSLGGDYETMMEEHRRFLANRVTAENLVGMNGEDKDEEEKKEDMNEDQFGRRLFE